MLYQEHNSERKSGFSFFLPLSSSLLKSLDDPCWITGYYTIIFKLSGHNCTGSNHTSISKYRTL